jgi:pimeloyl-ACP methyl ester carboxylesterase
MDALKLFFYIAIIGHSSSACMSAPITPGNQSPPTTLNHDSQVFVTSWQEYADEINAQELSADCRPVLLRAATDVPRRGAVVMFHGFGGCPQQFFELGERTAARGFDVLLPLLPGHGAEQLPDGQDDLSRLPTAKDREDRYAGLARRMNAIMAQSPGTRVIVGFSLGGAISLNANLQAPDLYDRQLLLSPMLAIRGGAFVEGLVELLGRVPGIRNIVVKPASFRKECRDWQAAGRAGFCDYRLKHVVPLLDLEDMSREMLERSPLSTPLQIVAAGDEKYVSNNQIIQFSERQKEHGPISFCFMPADVPHEMLSQYENADRVMYWLPDLLDYAVNFIAREVFFPVEPRSEPNRNTLPQCRMS